MWKGGQTWPNFIVSILEKKATGVQIRKISPRGLWKMATFQNLLNADYEYVYTFFKTPIFGKVVGGPKMGNSAHNWPMKNGHNTIVVRFQRNLKQTIPTESSLRICLFFSEFPYFWQSYGGPNFFYISNSRSLYFNLYCICFRSGVRGLAPDKGGSEVGATRYGLVFYFHLFQLTYARV